MSAISGLSGVSQNYYTQSLFSKMDTDSSGGVSKEEFTSARPSDVSETMANNLYDSLDTSGTGSLSESDLEKMEKGKGRRGTGSVGMDDSTLQSLMQSLSTTSTATQSTQTETTGLDDMISAMDTDGDGTITQAEFVAARPSDVSEEMATNLWNQFDTESVGSLSTSDLKTAMAENGPPPPPPPGGGGQMAGLSEEDEETDPLAALLEQLTSSSSTETTDTASSSSTSSSALQAFLEAIKSYESTAGYGNTKMVMSSLLAMA